MWKRSISVSRNRPHFCSISGPWVTPNLPSALVDEMLALLGDHLPCFLFRQLFLERRLLEDMHTQLIGTNIDDCRQLALSADRIWAARQMRSYANNMQTEPAPTPEHILLVASDIGHEDCITDAVQWWPQHHQSPKGDSPLQHPAFAITIVCLARRLADASSRVDGRETSGQGISRGHGVQPHRGPAFCKRQDLWRPVLG